MLRHLSSDIDHADLLFRLIPKADRKKIHEYLFRGMLLQQWITSRTCD